LYLDILRITLAALRRSHEDEGRALLRSLEETEQAHTCPHGRPTMIHMSQPDLERGFGRR
jgi:DNA mismatch repair protein MutL|tara:strand:+ start:232 stop:411 length:180 start_codon:yes stop_codon:yes gene_type:complete